MEPVILRCTSLFSNSKCISYVTLGESLKNTVHKYSHVEKKGQEFLPYFGRLRQEYWFEASLSYRETLSQKKKKVYLKELLVGLNKLIYTWHINAWLCYIISYLHLSL
jgi:hypothetical protein